MRFVVSGGGTGGHIFPAIAIARGIKSRVPGADILFIGARGRMEMEKVPAAGFPIKGLWISGLQRRLTFSNIMFPLKLALSLFKAWRILRRYRPDVVIGVGGYASGPTLWVAGMLKIPVVIQEQNSFPGITNRLLAKKADKICVAYEGMEKYFPASKIVMTGNPVRPDIASVSADKNEAAKYFGLNTSEKTILAVGGSLGALTINKSVEKLLAELAEKDIQLIWQTGKNYYDEAVKNNQGLAVDAVKISAFIDRMDYAYALADVVVSRAGAIAISELSLTKKAVVLIPSPNVAEDHQTRNAMKLVEKQAAIMLADKDAKEGLGQVLFDLIDDENKRKSLGENIAKMAYPEATEHIVNEVLKLVENKEND